MAESDSRGRRAGMENHFKAIILIARFFDARNGVPAMRANAA